MQYLYHFGFDINGEIFEVKYTNLPRTAPKAERFKWFIVLNNERIELDFVLMTPTTRQFKLNDVEIHLDIAGLVLKIGEEQHHLSDLLGS